MKRGPGTTPTVRDTCLSRSEARIETKQSANRDETRRDETLYKDTKHG